MLEFQQSVMSAIWSRDQRPFGGTTHCSLATRRPQCNYGRRGTFPILCTFTGTRFPNMGHSFSLLLKGNPPGNGCMDASCVFKDIATTGSPRVSQGMARRARQEGWTEFREEKKTKKLQCRSGLGLHDGLQGGSCWTAWSQ